MQFVVQLFRLESFILMHMKISWSCYLGPKNSQCLIHPTITVYMKVIFARLDIFTGYFLILYLDIIVQLQAKYDFDISNGQFLRKTLMESTSMVNSPVDIVSPEYDRYPLFYGIPSMKCTVDEGDGFYLVRVHIILLLLFEILMCINLAIFLVA